MRSETRTSLKIPSGVSSQDFMDALEIGHGYRWTRLVLDPKMVTYGFPPSNNLPEILFTDTKKIILSGGSKEYPLRIEKMLEALRRTSQRTHSISGGIAHG